MQKKPFVSPEKLREIAAVYPTPFHLYDEAGLRRTARGLLSAFAWNKGYREYYAVKACPNPFILQILKEEGCGLDCASMAELKMSRSACATTPAENCISARPAWASRAFPNSA